jgi:hypothetical protein
VILGPKDTFRLKQIEKQAKVRFQVGTIPSGTAIAEVKLRHFFGKIAASEPRIDRIGELLQGLQPMLDGMDRDTLIQKLVWMEFERLFRYYALQNDADMQGRQAMGDMPAGRGHSDREACCSFCWTIQVCKRPIWAKSFWATPGPRWKPNKNPWIKFDPPLTGLVFGVGPFE